MLVQRAELQNKFIRVSVLVVRKWISKTVMRAPTMFLALKLVRYGLTLSIRFLASSLERRQFPSIRRLPWCYLISDWIRPGGRSSGEFSPTDEYVMGIKHEVFLDRLGLS